jgi:hypothetical protein
MSTGNPQRLQRSRQKPLPPGTICVTRPGRWGNPFRVEVAGRQLAVDMYRNYVLGDPILLAAIRSELRGRDLACWCRPGEPCHADVLLELANSEVMP